MERKTSQLFAVFCSEIKTVCECKFSAENWNEQTRQNRSSARICPRIFTEIVGAYPEIFANFFMRKFVKSPTPKRKEESYMRRKKGSTLAELVVVMAVVSIVSTMVVTFTTLVNGWITVGTARYHYSQSERLVSDNLRIFSSRYDSSEYTLSCSEGGAALNAYNNESGA